VAAGWTIGILKRGRGAAADLFGQSKDIQCLVDCFYDFARRTLGFMWILNRFPLPSVNSKAKLFNIEQSRGLTGFMMLSNLERRRGDMLKHRSYPSIIARNSGTIFEIYAAEHRSCPS
jgi:hypothetical protein